MRKRVAPDIYASVVRIRDAIVFTLDHTGDMQTDPDIYAVRQTAMTYLPEALSKYMSLPRAYAERQIVQDGKTSHDILLEQLTLMETKVHEVADSVIERTSQRLVTHGRFIADRFGESSLEPDLAKVAATRSAARLRQHGEREREREKVRVV